MAATRDVLRAHGFVDGGFVRRVAKDNGAQLVDPRNLLLAIITHGDVNDAGEIRIALRRVTYYDARPDEAVDVPQGMADYWSAIELLPDAQLGFGSLRGGGKARQKPRQKGVDTLIAVDMLVGAVSDLFDVAVLVAGDADFVPVVDEVRRRGVQVIVAAHPASLSEDLKRAADRFLAIGPGYAHGLFPPLTKDGRTWSAADVERAPVGANTGSR